MQMIIPTCLFILCSVHDIIWKQTARYQVG